MNRVGEKVKKVRIDLGMSQKQLAKKLGVAESFVNEVEQGRRIINEALIDRISKVLGKDLNDITMSLEEEVYLEEKAMKQTKEYEKPSRIGSSANKNTAEVKDIWNDAFGSVLKTVPVYKYNLKDVVGKKQLPIVSNKVEGYGQDKVLYVEIENDDMIGFRIAKGDTAFGHLVHEAENNSICLIEYNGERVVRQIKKLDSSKVLLVSNKGSLRTETAFIKEVTPLVRLDRVEIKL